MECVPMEIFDAFIHIMTPTISSRECMDALECTFCLKQNKE
jgi:hypothetical protein